MGSHIGQSEAMKAFSVCVLTLVTLASIAAATRIPVRSVSDIPALDADVLVEVYLLEAPLSKDSMGDTLARLFLFHTGLGFRVPAKTDDTSSGGRRPNGRWLRHAPVQMKGGSEFNLGYEASGPGGFADALLPHVNISTGTVQWDNQASVIYEDNISPTYWTRADYLGVITGATFNKWRQPVVDWWKVHTKYQLWNAVTPKDAQSQCKVYLTQSSCYQFALDGIKMLEAAGALFNPLVHVRQARAVAVVSTEPEKVTSHADIVEFYSELTSVVSFIKKTTGGNLNQLNVQGLDALFSAFTSNARMLVYDGNNDIYYRLNTTKIPYPTYQTAYPWAVADLCP